MSLVLLSSTRWSYAFRRIRMFWLSILTQALLKDTGAGNLLLDLGDDARTNGPAAFTDGEAQTFVHGDRGDQLDGDRHVVARHHHLGALRQRHHAGHVRRTEVELRAVVGEERGVTATFFLGQDVGL